MVVKRRCWGEANNAQNIDKITAAIDAIKAIIGSAATDAIKVVSGSIELISRSSIPRKYYTARRYRILLHQEGARKQRLLQVDGLIMPGFVELCTPHFVYALVVGAAEGHRRPKPDVEVMQIFQGSY